MITLRGLTKRYGGRTVAGDLSPAIGAGGVAGFPGPGGAGRSTMMRMIVGLDHPTSGRALAGGRAGAELAYPLRETGAPPDTRTVRPGRRADSCSLGTG